MLVRLDLPGTDGDQQGVVLHAPALSGVDDLGIGIDPRQRVLGPIGIRSHVRCGAAGSAAAGPNANGSRTAMRPVHELLVRRNQLDVHRVPSQSPEPEEPLDRRDASATDHYPEIAHVRPYGVAARSAIGALPRPDCGGLRSRFRGAWPDVPAALRAKLAA